MGYVQLTAGAYTARSLAASAQRCLNLYPETIPQPQGEMAQAVHNPTPGTWLLSTAPSPIIRCLYTCSNGDLYAVCGQLVCYVAPDWSWTVLGSMTPTDPTDATPRSTPVSMTDNGKYILMVDGSVDGWTINLATRTLARIDRAVETGFYGGAGRAEFSDSFFILNKPGTPIFYVSASEADPTVPPMFDPLDFASKTAKADPIVSIVVEHRVVWLLGSQSTEVFYDTGGTSVGALTTNTFPYEAMPGAYTAVGCAAVYSVARADNMIYFLSQDVTGQGIVCQGSGYTVGRISTHAIENAISQYPTISDAVGYCYQQNGHTFYVLNFPTADATWCYDGSSKLWHERCWLDSNGKEHRHRGQVATFAYGNNILGDWENSDLLCLDQNVYTDSGSYGTSPIKRYRSFPHGIDPEGNRRIMYKQFIANMSTGNVAQSNPTGTVLDCDFNAPDGTALEDYSGTRFVELTGEGEILNNLFTASVGTGDVAYQCAASPATPDYTVHFTAMPTAYNLTGSDGTGIYATARGNAAMSQGYKAAVEVVSAQYQITLYVLNSSIQTSVAMGTLVSGGFEVTMTLQANNISVSVQRDQDAKWLGGDATWNAVPCTAINLVDTSYTSPGSVIIGGKW